MLVYTTGGIWHQPTRGVLAGIIDRCNQQCVWREIGDFAPADTGLILAGVTVEVGEETHASAVVSLFKEPKPFLLTGLVNWQTTPTRCVFSNASVRYLARWIVYRVPGILQ